jgi:hypothetical protein
MFRKLIGVALIIAGIIGLILSIGGIVGVWVAKEPLTTGLGNTLGTLQTTVQTTSSGLKIAETALTRAVSDVTTMENTIQTASKTVQDTVPLIDSFSVLIADKLPGAVSAVQSALSSAQVSAQAIEGTLKILTAIPLLPIEPYNPDKPLPDALGEVVTSLDPIPQSLIDMQESLSTSQDNLASISTQVSTISKNVGELRTTLEDTKKVLAQYQNVLTTLEGQIGLAQENLENFIKIGAWIVTIFLIWLGLAQIGLLTQGLEMVGVDVEGERRTGSNE